MSKILDNLDFDYMDPSDRELKDLMISTLDKLKSIESKLDKIESLVTDAKLVDKKCGHPKYRMFYDDKEITDKDLIYLKYTMELTIPEICKYFYYKDIENNRVYDKSKCSKLIRNRLNRIKGD